MSFCPEISAFYASPCSSSLARTDSGSSDGSRSSDSSALSHRGEIQKTKSTFLSLLPHISIWFLAIGIAVAVTICVHTPFVALACGGIFIAIAYLLKYKVADSALQSDGESSDRLRSEVDGADHLKKIIRHYSE